MDERIPVTVMFDWAGTLIWVGTPVSYEDARISGDLKDDLSGLEEILGKAVDQVGYVVLDPELRQITDARGAELAERLAAELGRDFSVSYAPPRGPRSRFGSDGPPSNPDAAAALHAVHAAQVPPLAGVLVVGLTPDDGPFGTGIHYHPAREVGLTPALTADLDAWQDHYVRNETGADVDVFSGGAIGWFRSRGLELGQRVSAEVGHEFVIEVGYFADVFGRFRSDGDATNPRAAARLRALHEADPARGADGRYGSRRDPHGGRRRGRAR